MHFVDLEKAYICVYIFVEGGTAGVRGICAIQSASCVCFLGVRFKVDVGLVKYITQEYEVMTSLCAAV